MGMARTTKQALFVEEYLVDFNGTRAAMSCGYSRSTAGSIAYELLKKPEIQNALSQAIQQRMERIQIKSDQVLNRLCELADLDIGEIFTDSDKVKPIKEWPEHWRRSVTGVEVIEKKQPEGRDQSITRVKFPDRTRCLELIGKHIDVNAFKDRAELAMVTSSTNYHIDVNVSPECAAKAYKKMIKSI